MALKVLALVGGISKDSLNKKLYRAMRENMPSGVEIDTFDISLLPFFSQDIENDTPKVVMDLKKRIKECDALLLVTPEYNRSFPGVLKNAIDWGSRPPGQDVWSGKKAGIVGASSGNIGTFGAQNHLRQVMMHLNVQMLAQPEFYLNGSKAFDEQGNLSEERTREFIKKYWKSFTEFCGEAK